MGLECAHVLERPQKQHYDPARYARLRELLYVWYGNLGGGLAWYEVVGQKRHDNDLSHRPGPTSNSFRGLRR